MTAAIMPAMRTKLTPRRHLFVAKQTIARYVALTGVVALAGCQHTTVPVDRPAARVAVHGGSHGGSRGGTAANSTPTLGIPIGNNDPCAANLHDLEGSF